MSDVKDAAEFGALDLALLPVFFISYSVVALVQISALFGGRYGHFAFLTAFAFAVAQGFAFIDFTGFCEETSSAVVCGGEGRGLTAFAMVWVYVSIAMLLMFGLVATIRKLKGGGRI